MSTGDSILTVLDQVQRRARSVVLIYALAVTVAVWVGALILFATADFYLRVLPLPFRLTAWGALVVLAVGCWLKLLWPALRFRRDALQIAARIELHHPTLTDRLTAAVSFLRADRRRLTGSGNLRDHVVEGVVADLDHIKPEAIVNVRGMRTAIIVACSVLVVGTGLVIVDPQSSWLAVRRVVSPWSPLEYPRRNDLRFDELPQHAARHEPLEVRVIDRRGRLPDSIKLEFRNVDTGAINFAEMRMEQEYACYTLRGINSNLELRASGGDGTTGWIPIRVENAPRLRSWNFQLEPPSYTGWSTYSSAADIVALVDTKIRAAGLTDRPVVNACLKFQSRTGTTEFPLIVGADGTTLDFPSDQVWILEENGNAWVEVVDELGLVGRSSGPWRVTADEDAAAAVRVFVDSIGQKVTPRASLPIRVVVQDDVWLREVDVSSRIVGGAQGIRLGLYSATRSPQNDPATDPDPQLERQGQSDAWEATIAVASMVNATVEAGQQVDVIGFAVDAKGQASESEPVRLDVVTDEEYLEFLAQFEIGLAEVLEAAIFAQQESQVLSDRCNSLWRETPRDLTAAEIEYESARFQQRRVAMLLSDAETGAILLVDRMLVALQANGLLRTDVGRRLSLIRTELDRLNKGPLLTLGREFGIAAAIIAQTKDGSLGSNRNVDSLFAPDSLQQRVVETLEQLRELLGQWHNLRDFSAQLQEIRDRQMALQQESGRLQREQLQRSGDDLNGRMANLISRQRELAKRFESLLEQARVEREDKTEKNAELVSPLQRVLQLADELAVARLMRSAALQIDRSRWGQATTAQTEAIRGIERMIAELRRQTSADSTGWIDSQRDALTNLAQLRDKATALRDEMQPFESMGPAELAERTAQLQELASRTGALSRELDDLAAAAGDPGRPSINRAAQAAAAGAEEIDDRDIRQAAAEMDRAIAEMNQAGRQIADAVAAVEDEARSQQAGQILQQLESLRDTQQTVRDRTEQWLRERSPQAPMESHDIAAIVGEQQSAQDSTRELIAQSDDRPALRIALQQVEFEMGLALSMLHARGEMAPGLEAMDRALELLNQLIESIRQQQEQQTSDNQSGPTPRPDEDGNESDERRRPVDLRTIRVVQDAILQQTALLESSRNLSSGALTESQRRRVAQLASLQRDLIELMNKAVEDIRDVTGESSGETPPDEQKPLILPLPGQNNQPGR